MRRFIVSFEPCRFQFLLTSRELNLPQPACLIALIVSFSGYSEAMVPPNPPPAVRLPNGTRTAAFGGPIIRKCLTLNPRSNLLLCLQ
ncbi:Pleckstrin like domain containing family H member 2 [Dissostichus eleginoides]|uniref:Pleckstrin like domain containing family H member 2 n=1 Tax=Dissostichus eleginoides TaxID=100907 RepID=A0AAD9FKN7_DISEL|nr:Pleckstrin like domain containing family H member 2 [Dissostichus eleginoides]